MTGHAKASSAFTPGRIAFACLLAALTCLGISAPSAGADPKGIVAYFGNENATGQTLGGLFSTSPRGVAVRNSTGEVYVADAGNNRIQVFDSTGAFQWALGLDVIPTGLPGAAPPINEKQTVTVNPAVVSGDFKLTFSGQTTGNISFNATVPQLQAALESLSNIEVGDVEVTLNPGGNAGGEAGKPAGPWTIEFQGQYADTDVPQLVRVNGSPENLSVAGNNGLPITTDVVGAGAVEKCTQPADCKAGLNAAAAAAFGQGGAIAEPQGIAVNQTTGDFYVTSPSNAWRRIDQFEADGTWVRSWGQDVVASGSEQADEKQALTVNASGGDYKLAPVTGLASGVTTVLSSNEVTLTIAPSFGSFNLGDEVTLATTAGVSNIAAGTTITACTPNCSAPTKLTLSNPASAGGSNRVLTGYAATTADIASSASPDTGAASVQARLTDLPGIDPGDVTVVGGPGSAGGATPYLITFTGALADTDHPPIAVKDGTGGLTGGTATALIHTVENGAIGFEICTEAANCKAGDAIAGPGIAARQNGYPAIAPSTGNILVGDSSRRVVEFTSAGEFVRAFGWNTVSAGPSEAGAGFEVCRAASFDACIVGAGSGGSGTGQFSQSSAANPTPERVAVDTAGNIYTVENTANFRVQKFTPSGGGNVTPSPYIPATLTGTATTAPTDIAVDTNEDANPANDRIFVVKAFAAGTGTPAASVAERRVLEFDTSDGLQDTHLANAAINSVNGFAIVPGGDAGYLSSSTPKAGVYLMGIPTPAPTVTLQATDPIEATCATFNGTINPNGGALPTTYRFEYSGDGGSTWARVPNPPASVGNDTDDVTVSQTACGLEPNKAYLLRLVAAKIGDTVTDEGGFETLDAPPTAQTFAAYWDAGAEELVLRGSVNPNNNPTTYHFLYGTEPCSTPGACESVPASEDADAGSGGQPLNVSQRVAEVERGATYHFRILADNGVGDPAQGAELEFAVPAAEDCDNEQLREENGSTGLPECRAFEWVSNGDSWGSGVDVPRALSPDGNHVQFRAKAFNNPDSTPGASAPYTSVRGGSRWSVQPALPPGALASNGDLLPFYFSSEDLTKLLWPGMSIGQQLRGQVNWLIEGIDGSSVVAHAPMIPWARTGPVPDTYRWQVASATPDLSAFIFRSLRGAGSTNTGESYLPGEPLLTGSNNSLYQISDAATPDSKLELVNRATDLGPGVPGPVIGGGCGATGHKISADGTIVYFSARPTAPPGASCAASGNPLRLFKRVGGSETVAIGNPAAAGGDDAFQAASGDGLAVFFTSPRQLAGSDGDSTEDLYLYDEQPPSGEPKLVQVSAGEAVAVDHPTAGVGAEVISVPATAVDGSRAYFTARGRLVPGATKGAVNLYVYERSDDHPAGRIGLIATLGSTAGSFTLAPDDADGDGRFLVFTTATKLLPEDTDSSTDVYRYDDATEELVCASCMGSGAFGASLGINLSGSPVISDDGSTIVFNTSERLLEDDDLNGVSDVYVWREGSLGLASSGSGQLGASSGLLSRDGRNVFFHTRAPLNGADTNNASDIYAARIDGGFPVPDPRAICASGEECQGQAGSAPGSNSAASPGFEGQGNVREPAPKACGKAKLRRGNRCLTKRQVAQRACAKRKGQAKRRCVANQMRRLNRAQAKQAKNRANTDRGGNR